MPVQPLIGPSRTMTQRGDKSSLWPLLLVRYSGASVCNPPERVRQQVLGSLAHGADGVVFYFPGMMDGPYWQMVARTAEEVARYEDFYLDGKRVEKEFALEGMPLGCAEVISWPGYKTRVDNPQWAYTAHELNGKVLLTLINLEESNDLIFQVKHGDLKVLESRSASSEAPDQWLVGPRDVGFVVLEERQGS